MKKAYFIFLGVLMFLSILISAVFCISFSLKYYSHQHEKNGVYEIYGKVVADDVTIQIVEYIKSERECLYYPDSNGMNIFSQREIVHMEDVKGLFEFYGKARILIIVAVVISAMFFRKTAYSFVQGVLKGILMSVMALLTVCILAVLNFGYMFERFHKIFFRNEFWMLDPGESIIINILPMNFFANTALWIFILTLAFTAAVTAILHAFKKHIMDSIY